MEAPFITWWAALAGRNGGPHRWTTMTDCTGRLKLVYFYLSSVTMALRQLKLGDRNRIMAELYNTRQADG